MSIDHEGPWHRIEVAPRGGRAYYVGRRPQSYVDSHNRANSDRAMLVQTPRLIVYELPSISATVIYIHDDLVRTILR